MREKFEKQFLADLQAAKDSGSAVVLRTNDDHIFTIGVEEIVECIDQGLMVILKPYSLYGQYLQKQNLRVADIVSVKRLPIPYDDAVFENIRNIKASIEKMRLALKSHFSSDSSIKAIVPFLILLTRL